MDLKTTYLGLELANPLVHSASPLTRKISNLQHMEDAGIGAIIMHSLFEEQIEREGRMLDAILEEGINAFAEARDYIPSYGAPTIGPEVYLEHLTEAVKAVKVPVIASLNGASLGGWVDYAKKIEGTGVAALELNLYNVPLNPELTCSEIEERYLEIVRAVCHATKLPIAVKISSFLTAPANFCKQIVDAGAKGVVLFNRFYQPDIDLDNLEVIPDLKLSSSEDLKLPLRWAALVSRRLDADLAISSGIHTSQDVIKAILSGAAVTTMASELLKRGFGRISAILEDLRSWMEANEYQSVTEMRGAMCQEHVTDPTAYERANYLKVLGSYTG